MLIEPPPRSTLSGAVIVLAVIAVLSAAVVTPTAAGKPASVVLAAFFLLAMALRAVYAVHVALFALLWLLLVGFVPFFKGWPLMPLAPLVVYGAAATAVPKLRQTIGWLHKGRFHPAVIKLSIATIVVSGIGLVGWVLLTKPDLAYHFELIPALPFWAYPLAGVGFAFFNAAMEEAVFRGIMMEALDSALGPGSWSVVIQASAFAAFHYVAGFPNGPLGFVMVLVYGILLGAIRRVSNGMLAPLLAHVAADLTIFSILMVLAPQLQNGTGV